MRGIAPSYEQKHFTDGEKRGRLRIIASPDGRDGSVTIHQDALLFAGLFDGDERRAVRIPVGRKGYVHVVRGRGHGERHALAAGDALKTGARRYRHSRRPRGRSARVRPSGTWPPR